MKSISFRSALNKILVFQTPIYIILILGLTFYVFKFLIKKYWMVVKYDNVVKGKIIEIPKTTIHSYHADFDSLEIFDSKKVAATAFEAFGERNWNVTDNKHKGLPASGEFVFKDGHLIIDRKDIYGKFVVRIKNSYYNDPNQLFVPKKILAKNPQCFKFSFESRSIKGQQKTIIIFREQGKHRWIRCAEVITTQVVWQKQFGSVNISCDEDFVIDIETHEIFKSAGIFQIRNFLVEETP